VLGIKECTCDEHRVLYVSDESLNTMPKTNITLYVNWNLNKDLEGKKYKDLNVSIKDFGSI